VKPSGEILREELEELGCSARELARALDVPGNRITGILREEQGITADTALRLARYFNNSPEFWLTCKARMICAKRNARWERKSHVRFVHV